MKLKGLQTLEEYIQFRTYNQYDKKIIFIRNDDDPANLAGQTEGREKVINGICNDQLYITYSMKDDLNKSLIIPQNMPILYYGGNNKNALKFLDKHNIKPENMYNKPIDMKLSGSKVDFAKVYKNCDWLPKTVFTKEEALAGAVGFPVIAKISDGHSGLGIKKFDTEKELKKDKSTFKLKNEERSFDLYSSFIDFDREYRCVFIKDKCFIVNERVPTIDENKSIKTKKVDEKVKFIYAYQDLNKIPQKFFNELNRIATEVREHMMLDLWSLDIVVDKQEKMWVLETNSSTGFGSIKLCEVYMEIYKDYYGRELPNFYKEELWINYISQGHQLYYPKYKKEIDSTLWPIDYDAIIAKYPIIKEYDK